MPTAVHLVELIGASLALAVGAVIVVLIVGGLRDSVRKTSKDALRVVLDPAAIAEQAEWEFTALLRSGELTRAQYRTLVASLAEDSACVTRPAAPAGTDRRRAS